MDATHPKIDYKSLQPGEFAPPRPGDIRSPCPAINALSNHGFVPRDGRFVYYNEIMNGLKEYGLGDVCRWVFTWPIYLEYHPKDQPGPKTTWWKVLTNPAAVIFAIFGMRQHDQKSSENINCLNLDQLALHNVVEHDVSLTRHDYGQGDNCTPQADLIQDLIDCGGSDGYITMENFVALRQKRFEVQKAANKDLEFQGLQVQIACTEVALVLKVFGDGHKVRTEYVRAFFQEGRIPVKEGWVKRKWWLLGLVELNACATKIKGLLLKEAVPTPIVTVAH